MESRGLGRKRKEKEIGGGGTQRTARDLGGKSENGKERKEDGGHDFLGRKKTGEICD